MSDYKNNNLDECKESSFLKKVINNLLISTGQPEFDVDFYRNYYGDLQNFDDIFLYDHYLKWGKNEGRVTSQKHLDQLISSTGESDFDIDFYRNYLSKMHICKLIDNYNAWGKNENNILSCSTESSFETVNIDGVSVNFYYLYPDFDIQIYKSFNPKLGLSSKNDVFKHYHNHGFTANNNYFKYDFTVGKDYNYDIINIDKDLIHNHYYFRLLDNLNELIEYRKQYEKKYYIFNKESFYRYYKDFDYQYYKNRYFKNNETISETDILLYYHTNGKYKKHIINNKINIIVYSPPYDIKCGGILVMHKLVKLINEKYNDKFCAKLFMCNNLKYENPFCNEFAKIDELNDNTIVVYPEIISGNPLNAKHVVRWILLDLGIEMPLDHYKKWGVNDLVYYWETKENIKNYKQLSCPFLNPIFKNKNCQERNETCYLIKKGRLIHKNIEYMHPEESICIDNLNLNEINDIFNKCKYFYSYDPNTAYVIFAAICGCIPIIYPIENLSENDYYKNRIFNLNNTIYNKGIVYGNDDNKIFVAEKNINDCYDFYSDLFHLHATSIDSFLADILNLKINENAELNNTVSYIFHQIGNEIN